MFSYLFFIIFICLKFKFYYFLSGFLIIQFLFYFFEKLFKNHLIEIKNFLLFFFLVIQKKKNQKKTFIWQILLFLLFFYVSNPQLDNYEIKPGKCLKINISVPNLRLFVGNIPKSKGKEEILEEFGKLTGN